MSVKIRSARPAAHDHTEADQIPVVEGGIADGAITEAKIGAGAVTETKLGDLQVSSGKLAAGAVVAGKIATGGVSAEDQLADGIVTPAKATAALKTALYVGDETEVEVSGITETQKKDFAIVKSAAMGIDINTLKIIARIKTNDASYQATLNVYHDGGGVADLTLTSVATTYEEKSGSIDISGWAEGRHTIEVKLVSADAAGIAYNELFEAYGVQ